MSGEVDQKQLMKYIELEKEIHGMETKDPNVLKIYKERENLVKDVEETLKTMETKLKELEKNTKREKNDVDNMLRGSIKEMFEKKEYKKRLTKEQEEYIEARSKEDMMRQEVEGLKKQRAELQEKANEVKGPGEKLSKLYEERDNLLSDIFGGEYGSQRENELEAQYDMLMDKKERVSLAEYKWTNGLTLLNHAVSQMHHGCQKWMECKDCKSETLKYTAATETRNNNIAAMQNIQTCMRYLGDSIKFPYCNSEEMFTLNQATENVYIDMQDPQRHQHAYQCYNITWKRAHALQQWFVNVINNTIKTDLKKVSNEAHKVEQQLRAERIKLIREKIEASGGKAPELNVGALKGLADGFSHFDQMQLKDEDKDLSGIGVTHPEPVGSGRQLPDAQRPQPDTCPSTPLPLSELAPTPCEDDLFGDISELKEQYKKHTEEFMKAQDLNKARMEQGLQAKLQARRHKKRS